MVDFLCMAGQMRAGKNEAGDYICDRLGFRPVSFASPVKEIFCRAFGVDMEFVEKWKVSKDPPPGFDRNVRQSLQFIGDGFRSIRPNVWVEYAFENNPKGSCFTDGRYINELAEVRANGGLNVLIWRPSHENNDSNESEAQIGRIARWFVESDISEGRIARVGSSAPQGCALVDFFLVNDGTLSDLRRKLDSIVIPAIQAG